MESMVPVSRCCVALVYSININGHLYNVNAPHVLVIFTFIVPDDVEYPAGICGCEFCSFYITKNDRKAKNVENR